MKTYTTEEVIKAYNDYELYCQDRNEEGLSAFSFKVWFLTQESEITANEPVKDQLIWVRNSSDEPWLWLPREFLHFSFSFKPVCKEPGFTYSTREWNHYSLTDPNL